MRVLKVTLPVVILLLVVCHPCHCVASSRDWHVILNDTGECSSYNAPADVIEALQALKSPYKIEESKEKGKLVKVRIIDYSDNTEMIFYTSREVCQKALNKKKRTDKAEADKYR